MGLGLGSYLHCQPLASIPSFFFGSTSHWTKNKFLNNTFPPTRPFISYRFLVLLPPKWNPNPDIYYESCSNDSLSLLHNACHAMARPNSLGGDFTIGSTPDGYLPTKICQDFVFVKERSPKTYCRRNAQIRNENTSCVRNFVYLGYLIFQLIRYLWLLGEGRQMVEC